MSMAQEDKAYGRVDSGAFARDLARLNAVKDKDKPVKSEPVNTTSWDTNQLKTAQMFQAAYDKGDAAEAARLRSMLKRQSDNSRSISFRSWVAEL